MASYPFVEPTAAQDAFEEHRKLLFGIAYRMLGTVADTEDLVQEAWVRWQGADHAAIRSPRAFLTTIVTRLAINQLDSARHRREEYIGPWLPEPLLVAPDADQNAQLAESLSQAFLRLLEHLSPIERAVLLLREVFDYEYDEVARMVDKTEANCRQILKRAKQGLAAPKSRKSPAPETQRHLASEFGRAVRDGDLATLMGLLSPEVILYSDGGGQIAAALNPIYGPDKVARFLVGVARKSSADSIEYTSVNGGLGALILDHEVVDSTLSFEFDGDHIVGLYFVRNPDKLRHLQKQPNLGNRI
ncbi:MAG: RNA polymerase sigma-70 factor [Bryobacteraceae bacterium]